MQIFPEAASRRGIGPLMRGCLLAAVVVFGPLSTGASAATLYVRVSGNDSNDGASPGSAFRTLGWAAQVAVAGDRIVVGPGLYQEGNIAPKAIGSVTFFGDRLGNATGDQPGEVILDASGFEYGFYLSDKPYMRIEGLVVYGAGVGVLIKGRQAVSPVVTGNILFGNVAEGIAISDVPRGALVSDNRIYDNGMSGIQITATITGISGARLSGNRIHGNGDRGIRIRGVPDMVVEDSNIQLNFKQGIHADSADRLTIADCIVANNGDTGVQVGQSDRPAIRGSIVYSNGSGGIEVLDAPDATISNNLVYANEDNGVLISGPQTGSQRALVTGNTLYGNASRGLLIGGSDAQPASPGSTVTRNIFQGNGRGGLQVNNLSLAGHIGDYNLSADRYGHLTPIGQNDIITSDAMFVAPAGTDGVLGRSGGDDDDFHLAQISAGQAVQSPAVDAGNATSRSAGMETLTTRSDEKFDEGQVDIGFHYRVAVDLPPEGILYVSPEGSDANSGSEASRALRTLQEALQRAQPGNQVRVAPGTYQGSGLRPGANVTIAGSDDGPAIIDAAGATTAFDIREAGVTLRNLSITGASSAAVRVLADEVSIVGCRVFGNSDKGILLLAGRDALVFNNLVTRNGNTGLVIGAATSAAEGAIVVQNSFVDNSNRGVTIGLGSAQPSLDTTLLNNVMAGNARAGVEVGSGSAVGLIAGYNCNSDGYGGITVQSGDVTSAPLLVAGTAEGERQFLSHRGAGQGANSPCIDKGLGTPGVLGLRGTSTRTDAKPDVGRVDIGYHGGPAVPDAIGLRVTLRLCAMGACPGLPGDCDGDGYVSVDEVVKGVLLALGDPQAPSCPSFDRDGDGQVTVDEIMLAVAEVLGSS